MYMTNKQKNYRAGWMFILLILIAYAAVGGWEHYLDRKLDKLVEQPKLVLVECYDGSAHYETLDGTEFACPWRKLIFM